jgi:hypothetical protein
MTGPLTVSDKISGVTAGTASTDAVNVGQLSAESGYAPATHFSRAGINSSTYTTLFTVAGNNLSSVIHMTMTGTSGSVVFAASFDITVNHSQDILVASTNGDYKDVTIKITSNNNEDFAVEAKHNGSTTTTAEIWVFPKAGEVITPSTSHTFTGAVYEHTATEGYRLGGEDNNTESALAVFDDKVGIGTTSVVSPLTIKSNSASSSNSGITLMDNSDTNAIFQIGERSTDGARLQMYDGGVQKIALYTDGTANYIDAGNLAIGSTTAAAKLDVNGGIRMADDATAASATNVGTQRYRTSGNNSYVDMCMQTGATTYEWINILENNW